MARIVSGGGNSSSTTGRKTDQEKRYARTKNEVSGWFAASSLTEALRLVDLSGCGCNASIMPWVGWSVLAFRGGDSPPPPTHENDF